jgi:NADPH:quinone reductase-like Zn-dependent oxidoreductase
VKPGQTVLIVGASGGVGTFAVQMAKLCGAEVTGVSSSASAELVRSLGADRVIDYTRTDFTAAGERHDLIFQLAGTHPPAACRRALTSSGTLILSSGESAGRWIGPLSRVVTASVMSPFVSQRLTSFTVTPGSDDLLALTELLEAEQLRPVISRTVSLSEVPEAISEVERGHTRGKIVVEIAERR